MIQIGAYRAGLLVCASIIAVLSACGSPSVADPSDYVVERVPVGTTRLHILDLVRANNSIIALASTADRPAGVVVRSDDEGLTWSEHPTLLGEALDGTLAFNAGAPRTRLIATGSWLLAIRTDWLDPDSQLFYQQAVAVSRDLGSTWQLIDLPTPEGTTAIVASAVELDGALLIAGDTQETVAVPSDPTAAFAVRTEAYDAAFWTGDEISGFQRLGATQFDGQPSAQVVKEVVAFDDRLIAIGGDAQFAPAECCFLDPVTVAWESSDDGASWARMAGLPLAGSVDGTDVPSQTIDGQLTLTPDYGLGQVMLSPGSSTWELGPLPDQNSPSAQAVSLPDGSSALTWVEDSACDCSVAFGGRLSDGQLTRVELEFADCEDDSIRGDTRVRAPVLLGDSIVAFATCGDDVWLASSSDGGASWETQPLPGYDGDVTATGIGGFVVAADQETIIALSVDGPYDAEVVDPRPVTALRISAGG